MVQKGSPLVARMARQISLPIRAFGVARRHPWLAMLGIVLLLAGLAGGVWAYADREWRVAQGAVRAEQPQEARDHLALCLRVWPWDPDVHFLAARAARLAGDASAAETHLNRCLKLDGGATERVQLEFLLLRVQTGEVDELAPVLFDLVEKGHPDATVILGAVARAYVIRLRYKPAYACLSRWIELEPDNPRPYHWRGWALERVNNQKAAREDYFRALELDPGLVEVRLRVAEMFLEDKQAPEALPHLDMLARQAPHDPRVQARMGMCLFLLGRGDEARPLMEAAVAQLPEDPSLLVALANLDLQEGRAIEAERWLRRVLKTDPSDTEALFVLSSVLQLQGRADEADAARAEYEVKRKVVDRINDLLKDTADSPTARADDYAEIGELFLQIGREKFGVYWLEQALDRHPGNLRAHRALAAHYERKGDTAAAAAHRPPARPLAPGASHLTTKP